MGTSTVLLCDEMATTVTAAHHLIWRHLHASTQAAQTLASKPRFDTPDKEGGMNTLCQEEEFEQICSRESLTDKAAEIEKTIIVKERKRGRYNFDLTIFYEKRFWNQRPDGIVINKNHQTLYILETLSVGFMRDKMPFLHVDVDTSTLPTPALP